MLKTLELEAESRLHFYHATRVGVTRSAELPGIDDVGWGGGGNKVLQVEKVEHVEGVCPNVQFSSFTQYLVGWQSKVLADSQVNIGIAGTGKDVSAAAPWPACGHIELGLGIREDAV